jgi:hypothetical protein
MYYNKAAYNIINDLASMIPGNGDGKMHKQSGSVFSLSTIHKNCVWGFVSSLDMKFWIYLRHFSIGNHLFVS